MKYINIEKFLKPNIYFNFFVGGRGVGKSYSTGKKCFKDKGNFLYLRTTSTELDVACDSNVFNMVDSTKCQRINEHIWGIYQKDKLRGYGCALSTFKNIRGVNFEDVDLIFQDEFIPEINSRKIIRDEATAWFNMLESVNRNRELKGQKPAVYIGCANANEIYNPYFIELGLIEQLEECLNNGSRVFVDRDRSLQIVMLEASEEFKREKARTVLYKLASGTKYEQMALNNEFSFNDFSNIGIRSLKGYEPIVQFSEFILWKKKNQNLYVVKKNNGSQFRIFYNISDDIEKNLFVRNFKETFYEAFLNKQISFENYSAKRKTFDIFKLKC